MMPTRTTPIIVIASTSVAFGESVAARLRRDGNLVYVTHSLHGCLRVATSVAPDIVLIDPALPRRLEELLSAHPTSANARILYLSAEAVPSPVVRVLHAA